MPWNLPLRRESTKTDEADHKPFIRARDPRATSVAIQTSVALHNNRGNSYEENWRALNPKPWDLRICLWEESSRNAWIRSIYLFRTYKRVFEKFKHIRWGISFMHVFAPQALNFNFPHKLRVSLSYTNSMVPHLVGCDNLRKRGPRQNNNDNEHPRNVVELGMVV